MEAVIKLRPDTPADLELLRQWDEQTHVIASDPNSDWGWEVELGRSPDWREQFIAELDGRPIGFLQVIDPHAKKVTTGAMSLRTCAPLISGSEAKPIWVKATEQK